MSETRITVEGLSKSYRIGGPRARYGSLRESLMTAAGSVVRRAGRILTGATPGAGAETFWALEDVSFRVERGEVVGIIGRNGAGKSTLLKILSGITEPTTGRAVIHGRVGSLLEVGTGFHQELTGRENIYLSGAILGMRKKVIDAQFDSIVAFADVERFLDTPVKRYSSGMQVRLGFAVAAHLDTEILLVDEVLAVGDAGFQKKCLGKMGEITRSGRTILFVSHNMAAVESLCDRCICVHAGRIVRDGRSEEVIESYMDEVVGQHQNLPLAERADRHGDGAVRFTGVRLTDGDGRAADQFPMGSSLTIEADFRASGALNGPIFGFLIADRMGRTVVRAYSRESFRGPAPTIAVGTGSVRCTFERLPLMHGEYELGLWLGKKGYLADYVEGAARFTVLPKDVYSTGFPPDDYNGGLFYSPHNWDMLYERQPVAHTPDAPADRRSK